MWTPWILAGKSVGRRFRRTPLPVVMAGLVLGLAIGLNLAAFSLVDAVILRTLPYSIPSSVPGLPIVVR